MIKLVKSVASKFMSSPDVKVGNFVKEYSRLHVSRRLMEELESKLQNHRGSKVEYNLIKVDGKYTWKSTVAKVGVTSSPQRVTPIKQSRHAPVTPIVANKQKFESGAKGGIMSGVEKFGVGCASGMSWGIGAFMGNLEQAAVNIFYQEE